MRINIYKAVDEATERIIKRYSIVRVNSFPFSRYAVVVTGHPREIYRGSKQECLKVLKALMAAALDGVQIMKEEAILTAIVK